MFILFSLANIRYIHLSYNKYTTNLSLSLVKYTTFVYRMLVTRIL